MFFQQDETTSLVTKETLELLWVRILGRVTSRYGDVHWSVGSNFARLFLRDFLKDKCYYNNPQTIYDLKQNISFPSLLVNITRNYVKTLLTILSRVCTLQKPPRGTFEEHNFQNITAIILHFDNINKNVIFQKLLVLFKNKIPKYLLGHLY